MAAASVASSPSSPRALPPRALNVPPGEDHASPAALRGPKRPRASLRDENNTHPMQSGEPPTSTLHGVKCPPLALLCAALVSCGSGSSPHFSLRAEGVRSFELPTDWREVSVPEFEKRAALFGPQTLSESALAELAAALATEDLANVRAAVLLTRSRDPRAKEAILIRLEERILGSTREADAGDVVGAAALTDWELTTHELDRLERLAFGGAPHPDVEVRTEIACTLVRGGRKSAVPFLLRVLREGTLAQDEQVEWERKPQMAWAKSRAAEALSEVAGVECTYQEDGAFREMAEEAARLELLLLE